jgi:hypothetical protein
MTLDEKEINMINGMMYKYIWNNAIELVKRDTLIQSYENGGMNMFHLKSKIDTINCQNFMYIAKNYERTFYNLSVEWLKFEMKELNMKNFNIIPYGGDKNMPKFYRKMIESVKEFRKIDKNFLKSNLKSKKMYEMIRVKFEKRSKMENMIGIEWKEVYTNINSKYLESDLRVFNYKVFNNALNLSLKFPYRLGKNCEYCKKKETIEHIFLECPLSKICFDEIKKITKINVDLKKEKILYNLNCSYIEIVAISKFKLALWKLKKIDLKKKNSEEIMKIFKKIFLKKII